MQNQSDSNISGFSAPSFKFLSKQELEEVIENTVEVSYNPGETIVKQGTSSTHIISIHSGLAKIYLEGFNNKNLIIRLVKSNELIANPGLSTHEKQHYSINALEPVVAYFIDSAILKSIFNKNHAFAESLMHELHRNYTKTLKKLININQKHRQGRIAEALLYLSDEIYECNPFQIVLTRSELADMTGMSTESSFRIIKEFVDDGKIKVNKKEIEIIDKDALLKINELG